MSLIHLKSKKFHCVAGISKPFLNQKKNSIVKLICFEIDTQIEGQNLYFPNSKEIKIDNMISHIHSLDNSRVSSFVSTKKNIRLQDVFYINDKGYPEFIDNLNAYNKAPLHLTEHYNNINKDVALNTFIITHVGADYFNGKKHVRPVSCRNYRLDFYQGRADYNVEPGAFAEIINGNIRPKKTYEELDFLKGPHINITWDSIKNPTIIPKKEIIANKLIWKDEKIMNLLSNNSITEENKITSKSNHYKKREFISDILNSAFSQDINNEEREKIFDLISKELADSESLRKANLLLDTFVSKKDFEEFKHGSTTLLNHKLQKTKQRTKFGVDVVDDSSDKVSNVKKSIEAPNPIATVELLNNFIYNQSLLKLITHAEGNCKTLVEKIEKAKEEFFHEYPKLDNPTLETGIHNNTYNEIHKLINHYFNTQYAYTNQEGMTQKTPFELLQDGVQYMDLEKSEYKFNEIGGSKFKEKYRSEEGKVVIKIKQIFKEVFEKRKEINLVLTETTGKKINDYITTWNDDFIEYIKFIFQQINDHTNIKGNKKNIKNKKIYILIDNIGDVLEHSYEGNWITLRIIDQYSYAKKDPSMTHHLKRYQNTYIREEARGIFYFEVVTPLEDKIAYTIKIFSPKDEFNTVSEPKEILSYSKDLLERNDIDDKYIWGFEYRFFFPDLHKS